MNQQESLEATIEGLKETVRSQRVEMEALKAQLLQAEAPRPRETTVVFEEQALLALFAAAGLAGLNVASAHADAWETNAGAAMNDAEALLSEYRRRTKEARDGQ